MWQNKARGFKVLIDGKEAGTLKNDSAEEFTVAPGSHTVHCKVDWCGSEPVNVHLRANEIAYLEVKNGMKYYWLFTILAMMGLFASFTRKFHVDPMVRYIGVVAAIPGILYLLYFITIGRNKYLKVELDKSNVFAK